MVRLSIIFFLISFCDFCELSEHVLNSLDQVPIHSLHTALKHTGTILICRKAASEDPGQNAKWFFSPKNESSFKSIINRSRLTLTTAHDSLKIDNVSIEDAGKYICCFHQDCMGISLVVLEFENILSFAPSVDDVPGEITVSSKGDFTITAHYGTEVNVEIFKEPHIPILHHFTGKALCWENNGTNSITYKIHNGKLENSGTFLVQSSFKNLTGNYHLNIRIQGKPVLDMKKISTEDEIKFICRDHAFPPPEFQCLFIAPEYMEDEDNWKILDSNITSNHSIYFNATAIMKKPISGPGVVECRASNSEGSGYADYTLENDYVENGIFTTEGSRPQLELVVISPNGAIHIGDTVHLQCKASSTDFFNIFTLQYNGTHVDAHGKPQNYGYVADFKINASIAEEVVCTAALKDGSQLTSNITLPVELATMDVPQIAFSIFIFFIAIIIISVILKVCKLWLRKCYKGRQNSIASSSNDHTEDGSSKALNSPEQIKN